MADAIANPLNKDIDLRQSFRNYESGIAFDNARRAAVFAAIFMLAGWSLDWVVFPHKAWDFLLIRALCAILLGGVFLHLGRFKNPKIAHQVAHGIAQQVRAVELEPGVPAVDATGADLHLGQRGQLRQPGVGEAHGLDRKSVV